MLFGSKNLKTCNDCPAYTWAGETTSVGDCGCYCAFGAFSKSYDDKKQIPPNCPIRQMRDKIKSLEPNATGERCAVAHTLDPIVGTGGQNGKL
jgi:hypothetical protein